MKRAWIETMHRALDQRTEWRIVADGDVLHCGAVNADSAGTFAYETAQLWASRNNIVLDGWKHAIDGVVDHGVAFRSRTSTDVTMPVRLYGWVNCGQGGREGVVVTPQQLHELEHGVVPCPVCGDTCGATLEPSIEVKAIALSWNGTRWHGQRA